MRNLSREKLVKLHKFAHCQDHGASWPLLSHAFALLWLLKFMHLAWSLKLEL